MGAQAGESAGEVAASDVAAADVVVVGGGLVGAAAAYEAARAGAVTVLVDRHDPGAATQAGAGILSPETWGDPDDEWFGFAMAAADHYRRLVPELEAGPGPATGYDRNGLLTVALADTEVPWFEERLAIVRRRSGGSVDEVPADEATRRFPPLGPVARALWNPAAARVDGRRMAAALLFAAAGHGLRRLPAEVTRLTVAGDRVVGVDTTAGPVSAGTVVVAGGAWTPALSAPLGLSLPVTPTRGQIVHVRLPGADTARWPIVQPVATFYLVPWPDGRVACGGTLEPDAGFDARVTAGGLFQLLRELGRVAPGLRAATVVDTRVGLRPTSADDRPLLGAVPGWAGLHVATGHGTEGLLLGPHSARLVVAAALAGRPDPALAPFDPGRFSPSAG